MTKIHLSELKCDLGEVKLVLFCHAVLLVFPRLR